MPNVSKYEKNWKIIVAHYWCEKYKISNFERLRPTIPIPSVKNSTTERVRDWLGLERISFKIM